MKRLIFLLAIVVYFTFVGTISDAVQKNEIVLYLPFDEGKGKTAKDTSEFKNDGTLHQAKWAKGKYGNAVPLNGENGGWVEVPDSPSLDITDEWFRILVKT